MKTSQDEITEDRVLAYLNLGPEGAKWPLGLVRYVYDLGQMIRFRMRRAILIFIVVDLVISEPTVQQ